MKNKKWLFTVLCNMDDIDYVYPLGTEKGIFKKRWEWSPAIRFKNGRTFITAVVYDSMADCINAIDEEMTDAMVKENSNG